MSPYCEKHKRVYSTKCMDCADEERRTLKKVLPTEIQIGYCSRCDWFTQQTLHPTTRPRNRCSRCGTSFRGLTESGERKGFALAYVRRIVLPIKHYSQKGLKKLYLQAGGRMEKFVNGKLVDVKER